MYCRECGNELPAGLAHCPYCGVERPTGDYGVEARPSRRRPAPKPDRDDPLNGPAPEPDGGEPVEAPASGDDGGGLLDDSGLDREVDEFWGEASEPDSGEPYEIELPAGEGRRKRSWIPILIGCGAAAVVAVALGLLVLDPFGWNPQASADPGQVPASEEPLDGSGTATEPPSAGEVDDGIEADDAAGTGDLGYGNFDDDYLLPEGSTRAYTREELERLDSKVLWYARNEMYALHGKGFRTEELRDYFESKPWYREEYSADEYDGLPEQLNEYELANEELMTQIERERNSPYLH